MDPLLNIANERGLKIIYEFNILAFSHWPLDEYKENIATAYIKSTK
jgi:hypothetical protein